jgi:hypothetical protein
MAESNDSGGAKQAADRDDKQAAGTSAEAPALTVIEAFGGIRPMAKQLGLAVSTVQGWKERSAIPANRHDQIRDAARTNKIDLDPAVLRAAAPAESPVSPPPVIEGKSTAVAGGDSGAAGKADDKTERSTASERSSAATRAGDAGARKEAAGGPASERGKSGFAPGLILGVVLAAVVAGATVYTQPYWGPIISGESPGAAALADIEAHLAQIRSQLPPDSSAEVAALSERLAIAEAALSQGAGQDPETRAALESLNGQLARMTDRLEALEQDLETVRSVAGTPSQELSSRLSSEAARLDEMLAAQAELSARLAEAEASLDATQAARDAAPGSEETLLLLATLQLRDALRGTGPYQQPLIMLKNLAEEEGKIAGIIAPLERRAPVGLPSLAELQAAYPESARRVAAIEFGEEGEGWTAGVLRRLSEAVNLRPVGMVEGDTPTAITARAEVKLNQGDLAGALAELNNLSGAAAEAMANWRGEAEARLAGDQAVNALGALVSQRFSSMADG